MRSLIPPLSSSSSSAWQTHGTATYKKKRKEKLRCELLTAPATHIPRGYVPSTSFTLPQNMHRLKKYVTPEEEEAQRKRRRVTARQRVRRLRSNPGYSTEAAAPRRQRRAGEPEYCARDEE